MNASDRAQLFQFLQGRREAIADSWYQAIAHTGISPLNTAEERNRLGELTEQAIVLLLAEPFERRKAREIGASLAGLHCLSPETLSNTQEALARELTRGLPAGSSHGHRASTGGAAF